MLISPRLIFLGLLTAGFSSCGVPAKLPPQRAMQRHVDLKKFMGDWYVIAHIPTFIEKDAYNAVENYQLTSDGTIATTFTFNQGSLTGPLKTYKPRGFIHNRETNAEWRMQFVWPFKGAYLITFLAADYQTTIVGVPDRKYVWIMARSKTLPAALYEEMVSMLKEKGHDVSKLRRVPQQ